MPILWVPLKQALCAGWLTNKALAPTSCSVPSVSHVIFEGPYVTKLVKEAAIAACTSV